MENNIKDIENIENRRDFRYTPIENAVCNLKTIRILKRLMNSRVSEMTGINTYLYQFFISRYDNPNLANIFRRIAINEMKHLELLADAIIKFGGIPTFNYRDNFWNARFVNYENVGLNIIRNNIRDENKSIIQYKHAIENVENESLKQLFREIILDKERHIQELSSFLPNNWKKNQTF